METIDFGCQVRCLNRQKLIPGSTHPQLNQCASKFLAKVKKEVNSPAAPATVAAISSGGNDTEVGWMKLKLSQRGLRIFPAGSSSSSGSSFSTTSSSSSSSSASGPSFNLSSSHRKSDEGFESDSEHSDHPMQPESTLRANNNRHSGGSSSGVNSSSSDLEEPESTVENGMRNSSKKKSSYYDRMLPIRCALSDILSCQHPPALGRNVVLLTLRSADDSALDILALECSAEEPAGILTLLCQKIAANPAAVGVTSTSVQPALPVKAGNSSTTTTTTATTKATVSVQSWSEREKMLDALIDSTKPSATKSIIRQLERQHSEWNLIQRRTDDGLTHLQVSGSNHLNHKNVHVNNVVVGGGGGVRKAATTSGILNLKKAMPSGGQLARLETTLAITNSHSGSRSGVVSVASSDANSHPPSNNPSKKSSGSSIPAGGLKRSDTMHQKLVQNGNNNKSSVAGSCILSLQTPELPLSVANASTSTSDAPAAPPAKSRWSFGAPFRQQVQAAITQQRPISPEVSRRNSKQRGRSCERKPAIANPATSKKSGQQQQQQQRQSDLDGLFISSSNATTRNSNPATIVPTPKIKRDPSKTRSFLMKLTSSASRKSPTPPSTPPPPSTISSAVDHPQEHSKPQRGRSLVRLRSSNRLQSPPPPPSSSNASQTFLIPTKSGQELTRNIYPKEGCRTTGPSQPVFHLLAGGAGGRGGPSHRYNGPVTAGPNGWASYCWNEALRHPVAFSPSDANNNQQPQHHQQQWIYFHPHPVAAPPPPSAAVLKAASDLKRIQRSRSQSPGRRNSQRLAASSSRQQQQQQAGNLYFNEQPRWLAPPPPPAVGHYYAVSSGPPSIQQPVSLPPDVSHLSSRGQESCRSFRRSKSSTRLSSRHLQTKSERYGSSTDRLANNKAVTFHAFATVQLVD